MINELGFGVGFAARLQEDQISKGEGDTLELVSGFIGYPTGWEIKRQSGQGLGLGVRFKISQKKNGCKTVTNFSHTLLCSHTTSGLHLEFNLGTVWEGFPSPSAAAGRFHNPVLHESCLGG